MSWQIVETGGAREVEAKIKRDAKKDKLAEPENTVRNLICSAVEKLLETYPDHYGVSVKIRGAQMPAYDFETAKQTSVVNALLVEIAPLPGYHVTPEGLPKRFRKQEGT